jgi:hypothetical protein
MERTFFSRAPYVCSLAVLFVTLGFAPTALSQPNSAIESMRPRRAIGPAATVRSVRAEPVGAGARIVIDTDVVAEFRDFTLSDPFRIVIDLSATRCDVTNKVLAVNSSFVEQVRTGKPAADTVRIVIDVKGQPAYRTSREGTSLVVDVGDFLVEEPSREGDSARDGEVRVAGARIDSESPPAAGREEIKALLARIEELESRVRGLEAEKARASEPVESQPASARPDAAMVASTTSPAPKSAARPQDHQDHQEPPVITPRMEIQGYADVSFHASNEAGKTSTFAVGQLDLFLTSRLSDKFSVLGELVLDANRRNEFSFEIHRLMLRYTPNDYFNLGVGRYHTAIGYYNSAYHHGQWFQTAANRPFIFAFEGQGGVLPIHNVGLTATGRIPSGRAGLSYIAEVGNGRTSRSKLDPAVQTSTDENNRKSFNLGLISRPEVVPGLQLGFSLYRDRLTPQARPRVGQTISAAHVVYRNSDYEWLNEVIDIRHSVEGRVLHTPAFYTQIARRFGEAWPYFRYQYINVPDDDPINPDVGRRNGPSAGLRYNLSEFAALKVQYDRTARRRFKTIDELVLQLGFTF